MSKKIMVVPDVHGRRFWTEAKNFDGEIVFLGDYLDSYRFEEDVDHTAEAVWDNFLEIIKFKQENLDRVTLLWGNHDFHYIHPFYDCSRKSSVHLNKWKEIEPFYGLFKYAHAIGNTLFTHAGVTNGWLEKNGIEIKDADDCAKKINVCSDEQMMQCGPLRGGYALYSGPMWCDRYEHANKTKELLSELYGFEIKSDFPKVTHPNFNQIYAHSRMNEVGELDVIVENGNRIVCCDSRQVHMFEIE